MIKIVRNSTRIDSLRDYEIYIDNSYCTKIKDGETKQFDIPEGNHSMYLKIDWCRSNIINFTSNNDGEVEFICGSSICGLKHLIIILYITIFKNRYLFIKQKS